MSNCESLQTREAMITILTDLYELDHFAIILFDRGITTWRDSLIKATKGNVDEAVAYVKELRDSGGKLLAPVFMFLISILHTLTGHLVHIDTPDYTGLEPLFPFYKMNNRFKDIK